MCVCALLSYLLNRVQFLVTPWTVACHGLYSSIHGIVQARILECAYLEQVCCSMSSSNCYFLT